MAMRDPAEIFELVAPSVAHLDILTPVKKGFDARLWWLSITNPGKGGLVYHSECTGFLWNNPSNDDDNAHYLITAAHCVLDAATGQTASIVKVKFPAVEKYLEAVVVGADSTTDIAVLKTADPGGILGPHPDDAFPRPLSLQEDSMSNASNASKLQPGHSCILIGAPRQNRNILWMGTISAVGATGSAESGNRYGMIESDSTYGAFVSCCVGHTTFVSRIPSYIICCAFSQ